VFFQVAILELARIGMGEINGTKFAQALNCFPNLWKCSVNSNGLGQTTATALAEALSSGNGSNRLEVSTNNRVHTGNFHVLCKSTQQVILSSLNAPDQVLSLSNNGLGDIGALHLAGAFTAGALPNLHTLQMAHCGFHEEGIRACSQALALCKFPKLQILDIAGVSTIFW